MTRVSLEEFRRLQTLANVRKEKRTAKSLLLCSKPALGGPPRPAKPRNGPSPRTLLRARLDALWSLVVRKRDGRNGGMCRICGIRPIECGYHITPRGSDATRWDLDNGVGGCKNCNYGECMNRLKYRQKHIELFGAELIERLEAKARTIARFSIEDLEEIERRLKKELTTCA